MPKIKKLWTMLFVQLYLELKIKLRYLNATISELVLYAGALFVVLFATDSGQLGRSYGTKEGVLITLIGFLFWSIGISAMGACSNKVEVDERTGLLESEAQSVFPLWLLYFIQTLATEIFVWVYLIILGVGVSFFSQFTVGELLWAIVLTMLFALVSNLGMFGIGMIFAAGSIRFKQMGQWATVLQALLLMFSNVALPVYNNFQELIPYVGGVEIVRQLYLGRSVSAGKVLLFLLVNVVWMLVGILFFTYSIRKERRNGSFEAF
ncbi:hypothetical protein EQ500_06020 [Lactobacillus sp. XV13L]|nr:hypothetical protein [Lactobacillus sp. XV13L]